MIAATIIGNLGRDAEQDQTANGYTRVTLAIASQEGKDDGPTWVRCVAIGNRFDGVLPYLKKGKQVAVTGRLTLDHWEDREGQQRTTLECFVNELKLLGKKDD